MEKYPDKLTEGLEKEMQQTFQLDTKEKLFPAHIRKISINDDDDAGQGK